MTQKILLTGASGGLGGLVLRQLVDEGIFNVAALVHQRPLEKGICEVVYGDLTDADSLLSAVEGCDTILHLAALTHSSNEPDYFKINLEGTQNLLSACIAKGIKRFIFVSTRSAQVDGGAYALSKLKAEEAVKHSGLSWLILQPGECYGPGMKEPVNRLAEWVQRWPIVPCIRDKNCTLSPVYVGDVVQALATALKSEQISKETIVLAGPEAMTFEELIDRMSHYYQVQRRKVRVSIHLVHNVARILSRLGINALVPDQIPRLICKKPEYDPSRKHLIDFVPKTLEQGLKSLNF
jgi:nucleoside-diphosphate-sugar epimerase